MDLKEIEKDMELAIDKLFEEADLKRGNAVLIGGSTSEVIGENLGSNTNMLVSNTIMKVFINKVKQKGLEPVVQSCEHINRALVVERKYAEKYDIMPINVVPVAEAGGGFATSAMEILEDPVVIERGRRISAAIDIGDVFVAMHLDPDRVGVVVRPDKKTIGHANITMIRTREKLIGGNRSKHY